MARGFSYTCSVLYNNVLTTDFMEEKILYASDNCG